MSARTCRFDPGRRYSNKDKVFGPCLLFYQLNLKRLITKNYYLGFGEMAASIADNQFVNMRFNYFRNELVGWKYLKEYLYFLRSKEFS